MNKLASVQLGDDEEGGGAREDMRAGRKEGSAQDGAILENHTWGSPSLKTRERDKGGRAKVFLLVRCISPRSPVFLIVLHIFPGIIARVPVVPRACLISGDSCRTRGGNGRWEGKGEWSFNSNLEINLGNGSGGVLILWGEYPFGYFRLNYRIFYVPFLYSSSLPVFILFLSSSSSSPFYVTRIRSVRTDLITVFFHRCFRTRSPISRNSHKQFARNMDEYP